MKSLNQIEVIMEDHSAQLAVDVLDSLITSEVTNTIAEINHEYDLNNPNDLFNLSEMIAYHLEVSTGIYIHPNRVTSEFKTQLHLS